MNAVPEEQQDGPDGSAGTDPENWRDDPVPGSPEDVNQGEEDVDPDDEDADLEPTGVSEGDVDPDDDSDEDYADAP